MQKRKWITVICISAVCLLFLGGCGRQKAVLFAEEQGEGAGWELSDSGYEEAASSEASVQTGQPTEPEKSTEDNHRLAVYVCGAVLCPDVYYLEAGSIKQQALLAAGGFAEGAATEYVNLAEPIADGEKLYFPYADEIERTDIFDSAAGDSRKHDEGEGKINLNTATREELMTLSGIGGSKADAIIRYRDEHGPFQSVEELMQVSGIKEGTYNSVKDYVIVN